MADAVAAMRNGDAVAALSGFEKVTRDAPRFAEGFLNLGLAEAALARNADAAAALAHAVALKPGLRGAHLFLAISEYRLEDFAAAAAAIRKETALNPSDAQAWMWQGIIDLAQSRLSEAVADLDHAAQLDPKSVDILYHRGHAALELSRRSYEEMYKTDPGSWRVHQVLAQADVEQGNDEDAVEQYKQAIAAAPPQGALYEAMGSSLWRIAKYAEAEQAYRKALTLDPGDTLTMYKLGCLLIDRGDAAQGKPLLDKVSAADPSLRLTLYYLGRADAETGNDQKAVGEFRQVIADNIDADTTKQAYFQLSRAYRRLHDGASAIAAQEEYRRLDQLSKDAMQQKLSQRKLRADRDANIPAPSETAERP